MRLYRELLVRLGRKRWFSWLTIRVIVPADRFLYRSTGGRVSLLHVGGGPAALPTLMLTTTGRRTGRPRTTGVLYLEDDDRLVVVASNFGQEHHPAWSANLLANRRATAQIRTRPRAVVARLATEGERDRLWPRLLALYPTWDAYTERTDREFRMFVLEPVDPVTNGSAGSATGTPT